MKLVLSRGHDNGRRTIGILDAGEKYFVTLEDTHRDNKVKGETRIPAGVYEIKFREVLSGLTKKYRAKLKFFTWHLELQDVPNFKYVYIHIGNYAENTDGCILVGSGLNNNVPNMILNSTQAFTELYKILSEKLNNGEKVFIEIKD